MKGKQRHAHPSLSGATMIKHEKSPYKPYSAHVFIYMLTSKRDISSSVLPVMPLTQNLWIKFSFNLHFSFCLIWLKSSENSFSFPSLLYVWEQCHVKAYIFVACPFTASLSPPVVQWQRVQSCCFFVPRAVPVGADSLWVHAGFWVKNRCHFFGPKNSAEKSASPRTLSSPRSGRGSMAQLHDFFSLSFLYVWLLIYFCKRRDKNYERAANTNPTWRRVLWIRNNDLRLS